MLAEFRGLSVGEVRARLSALPPDTIAKLREIVALDRAVWRSLPGPQTDARLSEADITGYGGAAGGGKSDLVCGLVLTEHKRSVIFRREKAQTERVVQRITELRGDSGLNSQKGIWKLGEGRLLELGGLDNPGDERRWQGRDHDLKAYDEVTEMREDQVRYTMGWNRSPDPKQRCRVLMTMNPPTTVEGRWVIRFFAPWLDDKHPNPARPGELRWFGSVGDNPDYEVDGPEPFIVVNGAPCYDFDPKAQRPEDIIRPKSRTFVFSYVTDNPYYMASGYMSTLQALPEPLRSQMLKGDFKAGIEDDPWQVIPTAWIDAAMDRWRPANEMPRHVGPMDSMGVDVAAGGRDKEVIARRHGTWYDELLIYPGQPQPNGSVTGARVVAARRDQAVVHVDIIGPGGPTHGFLTANGIQSVGVDSAAPSAERSQDGNLPFFNFRSELWWRMREALDPRNPHPIALPDDTELRADLSAPKWSYNGTIKVESKVETKKRLGRSPDRGDAVIYSRIETMKAAAVEQLIARHNRGAGGLNYDPHAALR